MAELRRVSVAPEWEAQVEELRAQQEAAEHRRRVAARFEEFGVLDAAKRIIDIPRLPQDVRAELHRRLQQFEDVLTPEGPPTVWMREALADIRALEVRAGTAPPEPEPAIALATAIAPATATLEPAIAVRPRVMPPRPRPLRTAPLKLSRTLKPRRSDSSNHPPATAPPEPAVVPASPELAIAPATAAPLERLPSPAPVQQTVPPTDNRTVEELKQRTREIIDRLGSPHGIGRTVARKLNIGVRTAQRYVQEIKNDMSQTKTTPRQTASKAKKSKAKRGTTSRPERH